MKTFSLIEFAAFTGALSAKVDSVKHDALEKAAVIVETEAKRVIGTYDYGWPPLAPSTLEKKASDTPLLETGKMRDSIGHSVDGDTARVGSDMDIALVHELGTSKMPPRSFLQGAIHHKMTDIVDDIGTSPSRCLLNEVAAVGECGGELRPAI